jgi:penicillin-binding protein 2
MKLKLTILNWLIVLSLIGLLGRLVSLQVINHDYYSALANENRIKVEIIPADRGVIYDRNRQVLSRNAPEGRDYLLGASASQVLGYVGEGDREIVGKSGLELVYDDRLKGQAGAILVETDAGGNPIRQIGRREPVAGQDIVTTLDLELQQKAYEIMTGKKGALVASDPESGAVLALVSSPGFDPSQVEKYLNDPGLPLFNRAIGGVYPPGSVFKPIVAIGALEEGKADAATRIEDTGEIKIGPQVFGNWYFSQYGRTEGVLDIVGALKRSNDIFFYRLGESLGIRHLSEWAKFFGVGRITGIDLSGEAEGLMPDPEWKQSVKKEDWYLGDTIISSIGQGDILMTPLQVNQVMSVFAAKGKSCPPHLVVNKPCRDLDIQPQSIELVTRGLEAVTQTGGTAYPFFDFKVNGQPMIVAGKTGTAEFGDKDHTHAWFSGFAPGDDPNIVVTVLLEGAGEGSAEAAPVAKELLAFWFSRR